MKKPLSDREDMLRALSDVTERPDDETVLWRRHEEDTLNLSEGASLLVFHETDHQHYPQRHAPLCVSGSWQRLLTDDLIASGPLACVFCDAFYACQWFP